MIKARNGIIPDEQDQHDPELRDIDGNTVAMLLVQNKIIPPQQWQHQPYIQNNKSQTVAMILAKNGIIPLKEWEHDKFIEYRYYNYDYEYRYTVAEILSEKGIIPTQYWMITENEDEDIFYKIKTNLQKHYLPVPKHIKDDELTIFDQACYGIIPDITGHEPNEQDEDGFTVAMILAINNIIIPNEWYHDSNIQNNYNMTVAMYQARNGKIPDNQWYHDNSLQSKEGYTVALYMAKNGKIPNKQWYHNRFIRVKYNNCFTVQNFLQQNNVEVPEEWKYEVNDENENTQAMIQAMNGQIPDKQYYHDPNQINMDKETVAMLLTYKGIIPPKEWEHDKFMKDIEKYTVAELLSLQEIVPTKQWMITENEDQQIFDNIKRSLRYNNLPVPQHIKEEEMNIFDQAIYKQIPDITGHKPEEQDEDGFTVAMILAINNITIPKEWKHKPELQNVYKMTIAMYQIRNGVIIDKQWLHKPELQDNQGRTMAMRYARNGIIPPKEWQHKPEIQNNDGYTVALLYASKGLIPPKQWEHDKFIKSGYNSTVAEILSDKGTIPSQHWMITKDEDKRIFNNIKGHLKRYGYEYVNGKFVFNYQIEILTDTCQICLNEGEQEFIKSKCNHKICLDCFQQLREQYDHESCPLCRQYDWYEKIVEDNKEQDNKEIN